MTSADYIPAVMGQEVSPLPRSDGPGGEDLPRRQTRRSTPRSWSELPYVVYEGRRTKLEGQHAINTHTHTVSQSLPHSYQRSTWSTYTRSVLYECVAESQSQKGGWGRWHMPARQIFFILPRRVVCASARSDVRRWRRWCEPPQHAGGAPRDGT